mmetsp:Transcript_1888/g.3965  ORF Transcript_1888/g.3965 Transcript_1888/m.3965 type:complete len:157 (+) Transcript_1888:86-556(+)
MQCRWVLHCIDADAEIEKRGGRMGPSGLHFCRVGDSTSPDESGAVLGVIGVEPHPLHPHRAEIGYWIRRDWWGRGVGTEAVKAMAWEVGVRFPEIARLEACAFVENEASCRVLTKAGFEFEGRQKAIVMKEGKLKDGLSFGLVMQEEKRVSDEGAG